MVDIKGLLSNPMAALQSSRQPGGLLAPVTSFREGITDPRLFLAEAFINRTPITEAIGNYAAVNKALTPEDKERKIVKGADLRQRYVDTGELVFPDVEPTPTSSTIEPYELVDKNGKFVKNITEDDWFNNQEALLDNGYKLQRIPAGEKAAPSFNSTGSEQFTGFETRYKVGAQLVNGLNNYADTIFKADDVATLELGGSVSKFVDSVIQNISAGSGFLEAEKLTDEYKSLLNDNIPTLSNEGTDFTDKIAEVSSQYNIQKSQVIDLAYQFAGIRGQSGRGLSDKDFDNALRIISGGVGKQGRIDVIRDVATRVTSELNYEKDFALQYLQNLGDSNSEMKQYNALPSLPAFIDPYATPTVDQNDIIIDDATRKRLEQYGLS